MLVDKLVFIYIQPSTMHGIVHTQRAQAITLHFVSMCSIPFLFYSRLKTKEFVFYSEFSNFVFKYWRECEIITTTRKENK